jgi:serine/threonine-protein kinase
MGTVYQAEDQLHRRCCAVKMLNNAGSCGADELRRFHNEATAISRLSHPNIVQMYDSLEDSYGRSYLVMELLDGVDLFAYLQAEGRLTLRRTQAIVAPVAAALYSAHRLGIIHRGLFQ